MLIIKIERNVSRLIKKIKYGKKLNKFFINYCFIKGEQKMIHKKILLVVVLLAGVGALEAMTAPAPSQKAPGKMSFKELVDEQIAVTLRLREAVNQKNTARSNLLFTKLNEIELRIKEYNKKLRAGLSLDELRALLKDLEDQDQNAAGSRKLARILELTRALQVQTLNAAENEKIKMISGAINLANILKLSRLNYIQETLVPFIVNDKMNKNDMRMDLQHNDILQLALDGLEGLKNNIDNAKFDPTHANQLEKINDIETALKDQTGRPADQRVSKAEQNALVNWIGKSIKNAEINRDKAATTLQKYARKYKASKKEKLANILELTRELVNDDYKDTLVPAWMHGN